MSHVSAWLEPLDHLTDEAAKREEVEPLSAPSVPGLDSHQPLTAEPRRAGYLALWDEINASRTLRICNPLVGVGSFVRLVPEASP